MSFSDKRIVCYLVDQFHYCLLIGCIKMPAILKHQQFEDSESVKTESSISKCQQLDMHDVEKKQDLDKYEGESKGKRYILFPFITSPPPP